MLGKYLISKREKGIRIYAHLRKTLSRAFNGYRSVRIIRAIGIIPDKRIHLLKEISGKSDHSTLKPR
jgi:hypothetical protein